MRALLFIFLFAGCAIITPFIGGNFKGEPDQLQSSVSLKTLEFIKRELPPINDRNKCLVDVHTHLAGIGKNDSGIWVNEEMQNGFSFYKRLQFDVYLSASGIKDRDNTDREYVQRLINLAKNMPAPIKLFVFAFDYHYDNDGKRNEKLSTFYVPNDYVIKIAKENSKYFVPVISIHPYRTDSIEELQKYSKQGARFVKWLPNAMGIDPTDPRSVKFFSEMKKLQMTLITHTGEERAVDGEAFQKFGNPLLYRDALNAGNRIIMAHVASLGQCQDLENGNKTDSCFNLFYRLFKDPHYEQNLFADLSAITIHTRIGSPTDTVIDDSSIHSRLINGSDYPLPAINAIYRTSELVKRGYITEDERDALNEIYGYNPILFDLLLKRVMVNPKTKKRLPIESFYLPTYLGEKC